MNAKIAKKRIPSLIGWYGICRIEWVLSFSYVSRKKRKLWTITPFRRGSDEAMCPVQTKHRRTITHQANR